MSPTGLNTNQWHTSEDQGAAADLSLAGTVSPHHPVMSGVKLSHTDYIPKNIFGENLTKLISTSAVLTENFNWMEIRQMYQFLRVTFCSFW